MWNSIVSVPDHCLFIYLSYRQIGKNWVILLFIIRNQNEAENILNTLQSVSKVRNQQTPFEWFWHRYYSEISLVKISLQDMLIVIFVVCWIQILGIVGTHENDDLCVFWLLYYKRKGHKQFCKNVTVQLSPVKRICVFEHSVMTNCNCACPAIQKA